MIRARGGLAFATALLWIGWMRLGAPEVERKLLEGRELGPRTLSVDEVEQAWTELAPARPELLPPAPLARDCRTDIAEIRAMTADEEAAVSALWWVLEPQQREEGRALAASLPPLEYVGDSRFVEPETPALTRALLVTYGFRRAPYPAPGAGTPWATEGWDRRHMMLAAIALARQGRLSGDQAAQLLSLTLDVLALQRNKKALEARLSNRLSPGFRAAAIRRWAARHPSEAGKGRR